MDGDRKVTDADMADITLACGGSFHRFDAWRASRPDLAHVGSGRLLDTYAAEVPPENWRVRFWWRAMDLLQPLYAAGHPALLGWAYRHWERARDKDIRRMLEIANARAMEGDDGR